MNQNCFDRGRFSFIGLNLALKYYNKTNSKQGMLEGDLNPGEKGSTLHSIEQLRFLTRVSRRLPARFPLFIESKHGGHNEFGQHILLPGFYNICFVCLGGMLRLKLVVSW